MSQYISFYVKTTDDKYLNLWDFSRTSAIYQAFANIVPNYNNVAPLTMDKLCYVEKQLLDKIQFTNDELKSAEQILQDIKESTFNNADEKFDCIVEHRGTISEIEDGIHELQNATHFVRLLQEILNSAKFKSELDIYTPSEECFLYAGIECENPNKKA